MFGRTFDRLRRRDESAVGLIDERIAGLKVQIARCDAVVSLEGHPGWDAIKADLGDKLSEIDSRLDYDIGEGESREILQKRRDLRGFASYVENSKSVLSDAMAALAVAQKEREKYGND